MPVCNPPGLMGCCIYIFTIFYRRRLYIEQWVSAAGMKTATRSTNINMDHVNIAAAPLALGHGGCVCGTGPWWVCSGGRWWGVYHGTLHVDADE